MWQVMHARNMQRHCRCMHRYQAQYSDPTDEYYQSSKREGAKSHRDVMEKQSDQRNCACNASANENNTSGLSDKPNSFTSRLRVSACSSACLYFRSRDV